MHRSPVRLLASRRLRRLDPSAVSPASPVPDVEAAQAQAPAAGETKDATFAGLVEQLAGSVRDGAPDSNAAAAGAIAQASDEARTLPKRRTTLLEPEPDSMPGRLTARDLTDLYERIRLEPERWDRREALVSTFGLAPTDADALLTYCRPLRTREDS